MDCEYFLLGNFNAPNQGYANGQVLDTAGEGVPIGQLTVVELDGIAELLANRLRFSGKAGSLYTDLGAYSLAVSRSRGRALLTKTEVTAIVAATGGFGWNDVGAVDNPNTYDYGIVWDTTFAVTSDAEATVVVASYAINTEYEFALVLGGYDASQVPWYSGAVGTFDYGCGLFIKGGAFTDWTLLWRWLLQNTATLYAVVILRRVLRTLYYDDVRVPTRSYQTVLQPTCLSTFTAGNGTSLDAITPEVGGLWTERSGNFDIQTNRANIAVSTGARDVATVEPGIDDGLFDTIIRKTVAVDSGEFGLCLRHTDANNYWMVQGDLVNNQVEIVERNGGVENVRASAAIALAHSTDYDVRSIAYGQTIDAFLDGGNKCTYALAALNENVTRHGIVGNEVGQTFDNWACWPRTSAIYDAELDKC